MPPAAVIWPALALGDLAPYHAATRATASSRLPVRKRLHRTDYVRGAHERAKCGKPANKPLMYDSVCWYELGQSMPSAPIDASNE